MARTHFFFFGPAAVAVINGRRNEEEGVLAWHSMRVGHGAWTPVRHWKELEGGGSVGIRGCEFWFIWFGFDATGK